MDGSSFLGFVAAVVIFVAIREILSRSDANTQRVDEETARLIRDDRRRGL